MYKNNKKSKKNKRKPQNSNPHDSIPQKTTSETLTTPAVNISKPEEPQKPKFIPGQIIKLTDLISKPEYNGRSGVIRKELENGRYRIIVGDENDLAIQESNLKPLKQCPSEYRLKINGILIWPHIKGVSLPSMQWMDDDFLTRSFINPCDKNGPFKHYWARPEWNGYAKDCAIEKVVQDQWFGSKDLRSINRSVIMRDYETRLKKLLNWTNPMMWIMFNTNNVDHAKTVTIPEEGFCVYWDGDSKAPINDFLTGLYVDKKHVDRSVSEIRGPVVLIDGLQNCDTIDLHYSNEITMTSLNVEKTTFYNSRYHGMIPYDIEDELKEAKMFKNQSCRVSKIMTMFPFCETTCEVCLMSRSLCEERMKV